MQANSVIFWDFDGTLGYRPAGWAGTLAGLLAEQDPDCGITTEDLRPFLQEGFPRHTPDVPHLELCDPDRFWQHLKPIFVRACTQNGVGSNMANRLTAAMRDRLRDARTYALYEDTIPALTALSEMGWRHRMITNNSGVIAMLLPPSETARFYRIWFALLAYVNQQRDLVPSLPASPEERSVSPADAVKVRNALWADDALREQFIVENPAGLPPADLALVASWRHRVAGSFFILRYLKKHTVFLSQTTPAHAYGVLGLVSPLEEILAPNLPIYVEAVLLPFEGQIIYDGLLTAHSITFGPGIRRSLQESYGNAQEREGVITTLLPPTEHAGPDAVREGLRAQNARVLAAFRKELTRAGLSPRTVAQRVETVDAFARDYLLRQEPPRGLLELTPADLQTYLTTSGQAVNRVSFKRFGRFLAETGRLDADVAADLADVLKQR